jgi:hypothetical protein
MLSCVRLSRITLTESYPCRIATSLTIAIGALTLSLRKGGRQSLFHHEISPHNLINYIFSMEYRISVLLQSAQEDGGTCVLRAMFLARSLRAAS